MHPSAKRTTGVIAIAMHLAVGAVLIRGLFEARVPALTGRWP